MESIYSREVLDHFERPRNAGELADPTAMTEVENPVCGDVLRLTAKVEDGRMTAVRFKAQGCVPAMACGSLLTTLIEGSRVEDLPSVTVDTIVSEMGGLPAASRHAAQLAVDALQALFRRLRT